MIFGELPATAFLGISAALVCLATLAAGCAAAGERAANATLARPVPPIDAAAPAATQAATFATG